MQYKEVVGWRRSIRFFAPWRPVEREKLQAILEAVYRAPRPLGIDCVRCVVINRDSLTTEQLDSVRSPVNSAQFDMAPVYLQFYADPEAALQATDGRRLHELIDLGVLPASFGWTHERVDEVVVPEVFGPMHAAEGRSPVLSAVLNHALGVAHAHALLAAVDQGLGAQLVGTNSGPLVGLCKIPPYAMVSSLMLLGYPAGSYEDGGQRPREPFEEDFFEGRFGVPFRRDEKAVEWLRETGMVQQEAPLPWRRGELAAIADMLGLPK